MNRWKITLEVVRFLVNKLCLLFASTVLRGEKSDHPFGYRKHALLRKNTYYDDMHWKPRVTRTFLLLLLYHNSPLFSATCFVTAASSMHLTLLHTTTDTLRTFTCFSTVRRVYGNECELWNNKPRVTAYFLKQVTLS